MSAHHIRHASLCPAATSQLLSECTCGAPGSNPDNYGKAATTPMSPADREAAFKRDLETARAERARLEAEGFQFDEVVGNELLEIAITVSQLLMRNVLVVQLDPDMGSALGVYQRCRVCRAEILKHASRGKDRLETTGNVGHAARKSYALHNCAPVDKALLGFTWPELEELHEQMDRDMVRLTERVEQIAALKKARAL